MEKHEAADHVEYSHGDVIKKESSGSEEMQHRHDDLGKPAIMTAKLWGLTMYCGLLAGSYGFAASIIASSLTQPNFAVQFNFAGNILRLENLIGAIVASFNIGGLIGPLGGCLQAGAPGGNYTMFCFGRFFSGFGGFSANLSAFVYVSEIAPASRRGLMGGMMSPTLTGGYMVAALVGLGLFYDKELINWRVPLIIQVLKSIHGHSSDPNHLFARTEGYQISAQAAFDRKQDSSWASMLWGKYRRRSAIVSLLWIANMGTGVQIPINFGPRIYASGKWPGFYAFGEPAVFTYTGEIFPSQVRFPPRGCAFQHFPSLPSQVRVKGIAIGTVVLNLMTIWITFVQPTADAKIGWRFYLVFVCLGVVCTGLVYKYVPEVRGISRCFGEEEDVQVRATDIMFDANGEIKQHHE
ncbi:hypothetical protein RQP46_002165 [Phenoliferia psychrophenolica]